MLDHHVIEVDVVIVQFDVVDLSKSASDIVPFTLELRLVLLPFDVISEDHEVHNTWLFEILMKASTTGAANGALVAASIAIDVSKPTEYAIDAS